LCDGQAAEQVETDDQDGLVSQASGEHGFNLS
jgi:hypothetical protein